MALNPKQAAAGVAAVLAAAAIAVPLIAEREGYVPRGYPDPGVGAELPTGCWGHTGGVEIGKVYTPEQCVKWLAEDAVKHGLEIAPCLPPDLPQDTRAAFISFAFNIGSARFCSSGVSARARGGDLAGACADLSKWVFAGKVKLPGLVTRRAAERALCEKGLG
jgi:lysozyme